jgi:hypothetical protein
MTHILVRWEDHEHNSRHAWIPVGFVRRVTDSEWDIWEYWSCPANVRGIRWSGMLTGFLPA